MGTSSSYGGGKKRGKVGRREGGGGGEMVRVVNRRRKSSIVLIEWISSLNTKDDVKGLSLTISVLFFKIKKFSPYLRRKLFSF